jgi:hypothetical protein
LGGGVLYENAPPAAKNEITELGLDIVFRDDDSQI